MVPEFPVESCRRGAALVYFCAACCALWHRVVRRRECKTSSQGQRWRQSIHHITAVHSSFLTFSDELAILYRTALSAANTTSVRNWLSLSFCESSLTLLSFQGRLLNEVSCQLQVCAVRTWAAPLCCDLRQFLYMGKRRRRLAAQLRSVVLFHESRSFSLCSDVRILCRVEWSSVDKRRARRLR